MKVLYIGDFIKGNGPSTVDINVRDSILNSSQINQVAFLQSTTKLSLAVLKKIFSIDVIHVSGVSFLGMILMAFARLCGKKATMTMHGSLAIECHFNEIALYRRVFESIQQKLANEIMPVSNMLAKNLKINKKITVIPNGVDLVPISSSLKQNNLITLIGGGRKEKRNLDTCKIINKINNEKKLNIRVNIFGEEGLDSNEIKNFSFVKYFGFCDKKSVFDSLAKSKIFIQYSECESFSLSVAEAINYNCYIITSDFVGINDFITPSNDYIVVNNLEQLEQAIIFQYNCGERMKIKNTLLTWKQVSDEYIKCWEEL